MNTEPLRLSNSIISRSIKELNKGATLEEATSAEITGTVYKDLPPYQVRTKQPYFIIGQLFEELLTGTLDKDRLFMWEGNVRPLRDREFPEGTLIVKNKEYDSITEDISVMRWLSLPAELREKTGLTNLGELIDSKDSQYKYVVETPYTNKGKNYNLTGELDGLVTHADGTVTILEVKQSSKLFYPNHKAKIVRSMGYDMQVTFYAMLLKMQGVKVNPRCLFIMYNPGKHFGVLYYMDMSTKENMTKFTDRLKMMNLI